MENNNILGGGNLQEKDLISRDTYRRVKNYDRTQLSNYLKNLYHKAMSEGFKIGEKQGIRKAEQAAKAKKQQADAGKAPERPRYQPFTCWGMVHDTGTKLDGHLYLVTLWDWDNYEDFHLVSFGEHDDEAERGMMETLHDADECYADMPLEEFEQLWKAGEYEAPGVYTIPLDKVSITKIVVMEGSEPEADQAPEAAAEDPEAPATDPAGEEDANV